MYKSTKFHIVVFLETKVGNESVWNPEFMVLKQGYNCHLAKRDMEIRIKLEMGHNTNKISYNCNIKEMKTKLQLVKS